MKLIVNADDFGLSRGVNYAIVDAYSQGVVRSATLMAAGNAFAHAVKLKKEYPDLGVGVHLTLTTGYPLLSGHKTLVDETGRFHSATYVEDHTDRLDEEELFREFSAQIEKVIEHGIMPTHLDSHHHVHILPKCAKVVDKLAEKYGLPYRKEAFFSWLFYGEELTLDDMISILEKHKEAEFLEVMSHPGYVDHDLYQRSKYHLARIREYHILTDPRLQEYIEKKQIELINYEYLKRV